MKDDDVMICRCESVYLSEIKAAIQAGASVMPNIKMRHRAGMGHCQGRVCQPAIQQIIKAETKSNGKPYYQKSRSPVRPTLMGEFTK